MYYSFTVGVSKQLLAFTFNKQLIFIGIGKDIYLVYTNSVPSTSVFS